MTAKNHGWRGQGKARVALLSGRLVVRYQGLSTKGRRLQAPLRELFRKDYRQLRPSYGPYAVRIWIEASEERARLDVDNVANSCLDALTGVVWHDDSQVQRLLLERIPAAHNAITLSIEPAEPAEAACASSLHRLLEQIAGIES